MKSAPLVSILIPSFKASRFLRTALDSIYAQDYRPLEIVVADGGSNDGTVEILREYQARYPDTLRWISEKDGGPADAVNKALTLARGEFAAILSADDFYYPGAVKPIVLLMQERPDCGLVYGDVSGVDESGSITYTRRMPDFSWEAFFGVSCTLPQGSVFFRMDLARRTGDWNAAYYGCDLDYWLRLCFQTNPLHIPRVLSAWRRYEGQRTSPAAYRRIWDDYWRMIDESPDLDTAAPRLQRLACASKHLLVLRLDLGIGTWRTLRHLLTGLWLHPTFWYYNPWQLTAAMFPGSGFLRSLYRLVRGRSRNTR